MKTLKRIKKTIKTKKILKDAGKSAQTLKHQKNGVTMRLQLVKRAFFQNINQLDLKKKNPSPKFAMFDRFKYEVIRCARGSTKLKNRVINQST